MIASKAANEEGQELDGLSCQLLRTQANFFLEGVLMTSGLPVIQEILRSANALIEQGFEPASDIGPGKRAYRMLLSALDRLSD